MSGANVIFRLNGVNLTIQCTENDVMKDICQKYAYEIKRNMNTLVFLYEGSQLHLDLKFKDVIADKETNEMKVMVYSNENNEFICPKCGEKVKLNTEKINDIIFSINNLKETIDSAKLMLENVIKISSEKNINVQLKGINIVLNTLDEDIKKIKEKVKNLLNETEKNENNYIIAEIIIGESDVNKNIRILNSYEECIRNDPKKNWIMDEKYKNEDEIKKGEIRINDELIPFNYFHNFKSQGKYTIKYSFKNQFKNMYFMFRGCSSLFNINLSNFNTSNVTNMGCLFSECSSLTYINLFNFNTDNVTNMNSMFYGCSSLTNINLSTFNTNNVTNMGCMFYGCSSLTNINLSNCNFNNVTNFVGMFGECKLLKKNNIIIKDRKILKDENLFKEIKIKKNK